MIRTRNALIGATLAVFASLFLPDAIAQQAAAAPAAEAAAPFRRWW